MATRVSKVRSSRVPRRILHDACSIEGTFADAHLTDAIKQLAADSGTDPKVKRQLVSVLIAWRRQFEGDPSMSHVANLYKSVPQTHSSVVHAKAAQEHQENEYERRKREEREAKEEAKRKSKQAKIDDKQRREDEERRRKDKGKRHEPFDFEKEKPNVLNSIAETSQAANNLINALTVSTAYFKWLCILTTHLSLLIPSTRACKRTRGCRNAWRRRN